MKKEAEGTRQIVIETHKKFSESCLWHLQREYFNKEGINAWVNQVPFYITSNPFIANNYAQLVVNFILDTLDNNPAAKDHPFYILELGTGSGRFSYYALKTIHEILATLNRTDISICYIMSDFTKNNIQYYETHAALKPYIDSGQLDFAIFDMEVERPLTLIKKNLRLSPEVLQNPLIVFANYIFDTISHDAFTVHDGKLYELALSIATDAGNLHDNKPVDMEQLAIDFKVNEIKQAYYQDAILDEILTEYKTGLKDSNFLFPIGSIRAINLLRKLANNKLFIISSDKGYSTLSALENLSHPSLSFHGSFSMMVNFHALAGFFKRIDGDYFLQTPRKGIKTSIFCAGLKLADLPRTRLAIEHYVEGLSPADYFTLHRRMSDSFQECTLDMIAAHLNLSQWDPHIYNKVASHVVSLLKEGDSDTVNFLASNMRKIAANYYYMPRSECILFEIAVFFHTIKRYVEALKYYQAAADYLGEQFGLAYNMALCQHQLGMVTEAFKNFKYALTLDPQSKEANEWVTYLENEFKNSNKDQNT